MGTLSCAPAMASPASRVASLINSTSRDPQHNVVKMAWLAPDLLFAPAGFAVWRLAAPDEERNIRAASTPADEAA